MMFMVHMSFLYGLVVLATGFIVFHFVRRFPSTPLRVAGWILVIGGALNLLCNAYYGMYYWREGYAARPIPPMMSTPER